LIHSKIFNSTDYCFFSSGQRTPEAILRDFTNEEENENVHLVSNQNRLNTSTTNKRKNDMENINDKKRKIGGKTLVIFFSLPKEFFQSETKTYDMMYIDRDIRILRQIYLMKYANN
jgi:hypothetical protein